MAPTCSLLGSRTPLTMLTLLWASLAWIEGKPGCPSCRMPPLDPSAERAFLVEVAKQQILQKLNLSERPNITHPVPRALVANALRRLHRGKTQMDGLGHFSSWENPKPDEQGYEIISFAEAGESPMLLSGTWAPCLHIVLLCAASCIIAYKAELGRC